MDLYVFWLILINFSYKKGNDLFDLNILTGNSITAIVLEAPDIITTTTVISLFQDAPNPKN